MKIINKEYFRLYQLYQKNKLTQAEFNLLVSKINRTTWLDMVILWIFSPYTQLKSGMALIFGLSFMLFYSILAKISGFYFPGIPGAEEIFNPAQQLSFIQIFLDQILQWILLSMTFYVIAKLNKTQNIKLFDFLAFMSMAYLARVFFSFELYTVKLIAPDFFKISSSLTKLIQHYPKILVSIWHVNELLMDVWIYRLYFASLELASGLVKIRLWITYILGIVIAQSICYNLSKYLLLLVMV